jgi:flagellar motor switch protein FliG
MSTQPKTTPAAGLTLRGGDTARQSAARSNVTPSQRAAVIITMLGEGAAKPIVEKLDDIAMVKIAEALQDLSFVTRDEMIMIAIDFLSHLRHSNGALRGGKEKAREVLTGVLDAERLNSILGDEPAEIATIAAKTTNETPWSRLAKSDPKKIAGYLEGLTPNIIALILRKLDVSIASDVLNHMEGDKLGPAMGFMVESQADDPGIDQVLARMIELEFLNATQEELGGNDDHLADIGELLSLIPAQKRDELVKFLEGKYEDKYKLIQQSMFTIEGLPAMLPPTAVPIIFRELDEEATLKLMGSLRSGNDDVSEFLFKSISPRLAEKLRDQLTEFKDLSQTQIDIVHRDFLALLMKLKRGGQIELAKIETDEATEDATAAA